MSIRKANATWEGDLKSGNGSMAFGSGAFEGPFSFNTRFESEAPGTNPEELIAGAHAGCFSMQLSGNLTKAGFPPTRIETTANVHLEMLEGGPTITKIVLQTECQVPNIDKATFDAQVDGAKKNCPISRLLQKGTEIEVQARLLQ